MERRRLGWTELEFTTVGLGTWAIGGPWQWGWGPQDDDDSIRTIHEALDTGINWIDTAPVYGLGHSESVVGRAIRRRRDEVLIATKCGFTWDDPASGDVTPSLKGPGVRLECEASLRRLGVDVIDLYQVHWPNPAEDIEEAWEMIARLIDEGKIRYAGVSNFDVGQMERVHAIHPVASLQPPYSMLSRRVENEVLPWCAANHVGVVPYSPMQAGILTGRFTRQTMETLPADDWRHGNRHYQEPALSANLALVDGLRPIAERTDRSMAELAIAWVLRRPEVTSAIVGARRPGQIGETATASGWNLSEEDVQKIEDLLAARDAA
jgi:aryl-alcohol dehydrogenase-like predicted oxidoreductase